MNGHIDKAATYLTDKIYSDRDSQAHKGMKMAVGRLLEVLLLNTGIMVSTYFITASLSILSLVMTGVSSYAIYSIIKKIYRDLRVDPENNVTVETADSEFSSLMGLCTSTGWDYTMIGLSQLHELVQR